MILAAKHSEIPEILQLTKACAAAMIAQEIYQWNEHYPSAQAFETDIQRRELYVLKSDDRIIGTIVLSTFMDEVYLPIHWLSLNEKNLYIHRLAVHPDFQKQGRARQLMDFAEAYAKEQKFVSVRLDTFSQNTRNQKFYENRGYQKLGNIHFPKQSSHPFFCYELLLQKG